MTLDKRTVAIAEPGLAVAALEARGFLLPAPAILRGRLTPTHRHQYEALLAEATKTVRKRLASVVAPDYSKHFKWPRDLTRWLRGELLAPLFTEHLCRRDAKAVNAILALEPETLGKCGPSVLRASIPKELAIIVRSVDGSSRSVGQHITNATKLLLAMDANRAELTMSQLFWNTAKYEPVPGSIVREVDSSRNAPHELINGTSARIERIVIPVKHANTFYDSDPAQNTKAGPTNVLTFGAGEERCPGIALTRQIFDHLIPRIEVSLNRLVFHTRQNARGGIGMRVEMVSRGRQP